MKDFFCPFASVKTSFTLQPLIPIVEAIIKIDKNLVGFIFEEIS
jgi:hypothetical protein